MNVVEIIPQLFFDLIARAVPGSVFLGLIMYGNREGWETAVGRLWPTATLSPAYGLIVFVGVAYIIGHILVAPAHLLFERRRFIVRFTQRIIDSRLPNDKKEIDDFWEDLTWLRVNRPDLAILPTKILAEYTMYFGLAAAFLLATVGALAGLLEFASRWRLSVLVLVLLALACAYLGADLRASFALTLHGLRHEKNEAKAGAHARK